MEKKTVWPFQIIFFFVRDYNKMLLVYPSLKIFGQSTLLCIWIPFNMGYCFFYLYHKLLVRFSYCDRIYFVTGGGRDSLWPTILGKCASLYHTHNFSFLPGSNFSACTLNFFILARVALIYKIVDHYFRSFDLLRYLSIWNSDSLKAIIHTFYRTLIDGFSFPL